MFWLKIVKSIMTTLHSSVSPNQIAGGCVLGMLLGLLPAKTLLTVFLAVIVLILNVNIGSAMLVATLTALVAFFLDPLFHATGHFLLVKSAGLTPLWTKLYNMPLIPFTRFNNTVVLGSLAVGLLLSGPVFLFMRWFVVYYRAHYAQKVEQWKIMKFFKLTSVINVLDKYK